jgi:hypothetical protein
MSSRKYNQVRDKNIPLPQQDPPTEIGGPPQQYSLGSYSNNPESTLQTETLLSEFNMDVPNLWAKDTVIGPLNYDQSLSWLNGLSLAIDGI